MAAFIRLVSLAVMMFALSVALAAAAVRVVATTEDLASLTREVGGDRVTVVGLAKGCQDPHFVDPKPSFILEMSRADLLIVVGREMEIGWLPPLINSSRNGKIHPGGSGYLDASANVRILEIPTGQITRVMGDVQPQGVPHYWLDPANQRPAGSHHPHHVCRRLRGRDSRDEQGHWRGRASARHARGQHPVGFSGRMSG